MEIRSTRLALLLTSRTRTYTLIKGWNPVLAMRARKVNQQIGLGMRTMLTCGTIELNVRIGIPLRFTGMRRFRMPCGQVLQPGAALKKARPFCLFAFAAGAFKGKVLFVNALDVVVHRVLVDLAYIAVRTYVESCIVALVLSRGSRKNRARNNGIRNSRNDRNDRNSRNSRISGDHLQCGCCVGFCRRRPRQFFQRFR